MRRKTVFLLISILLLTACSGTQKASTSNISSVTSSTTPVVPGDPEKEGVVDDDTPIMDTEAGMTFTSCDQFMMDRVIECPLTFEVKMKVNNIASSSALGTIIGNYSPNSPFMNLEIRNNGKIAVYMMNVSGNESFVLFENYDIRQNKIVNLAVTCDFYSSTFNLYIDGQVKDSISKSVTAQVFTNKFVIGGDYKKNNEQYLKYSTIYSVSLFNSVRTQSEINDDFTTLNYNDTNLLASYNFESNSPLKDLSTKNNNLNYFSVSDYNSSYDTDTKGIFFEYGRVYQSDKILKDQINTWEAYIKVPYGYSGKVGAIIGSCKGLKGGWNFTILENGHPSLTFGYEDLKQVSVVFDTVDVRKIGNKWTHVSITNDVKANRVKCYIDGKLASTKFGALSNTINEFGAVIGGDQDHKLTNRFLGKISDISIFKEVRSDEQIASDAHVIKNTNPNLVAHYQLNNKQGNVNIKNSGGRSYNIELQDDWFTKEDKKQILNDYAGSMAVIGDIQNLSCYFPTSLHYIYDWLLDNKTETNLKYVMTVGDNTDRNTSEEWTRVRQQYSRLDDASIGYSINQGNHDGSSDLNSYFGDDEYKNSCDGIYNFDVCNTYRFVTIGDVKYIIFTLQVEPTDDLFAWVDQVLIDNSDCIAIMTIHVFMNNDYTLLDYALSGIPSEFGKPLKSGGVLYWNKCFKKHANIALVICGHEPCEDLITRKMIGDNGNVVTTLLVDPQDLDSDYSEIGCTGMICMLYFSKDGKTIQTEWFSSIHNTYHRQLNQITIELFK